MSENSSRKASTNPKRLDRIRHGLVSTYALYMDAVENGKGGFGFSPCLGGRVAGLAPHGAFFEKGLGLTTKLGMFRLVRQLLIAAEDNYTRPLIVGLYFIGLNTNKGILAHPFNLLSDGRKTIQAVRLIRKINGNNIRLILARASQPTRAEAREQVTTFLGVHFMNQHGALPGVLYTELQHHNAAEHFCWRVTGVTRLHDGGHGILRFMRRILERHEVDICVPSKQEHGLC